MGSTSSGTFEITVWKVDIDTSQNLFLSNFIQMVIFHEVFDGWSRIPNAWKPDDWEFAM
jgi:hypothetical protein